MADSTEHLAKLMAMLQLHENGELDDETREAVLAYKAGGAPKPKGMSVPPGSADLMEPITEDGLEITDHKREGPGVAAKQLDCGGPKSPKVVRGKRK